MALTITLKEVLTKIFDSQMSRVLKYSLIGLVSLGYVLYKLPITENSTIEALSDTRVCIGGKFKIMLIAIHLIEVLLIPVIMKMFFDALSIHKFPSKNVFMTQIGIAFYMVAISYEIGWHVQECWYFIEDYSMLNYMYYFFLITSFYMWSDGFVTEASTINTEVMKYVFAFALLISSLFYPVGKSSGNEFYMLPMHLTLLLVLLTFTYRGWDVLKDKRVWVFPFFSIIIENILLVTLYLYGGNPIFNPKPEANAILHILHDLLGICSGVAIFSYLVYLKAIRQQDVEEKEEEKETQEVQEGSPLLPQ